MLTNQPDDKDTLRLFVAIEPPEEVLAAVGRVQNNLKKHLGGSGFRWARPGSFHLTLKFIGERPAADQPAIEAALAEVTAVHPPLDLQLRGMGCFPNVKRPRVLWLGVEGDTTPLGKLAKATDQALVAALPGLEREKRRYHPHLTLARIKTRQAGQATADWLATPRDGAVAAWRAEAVCLMRSQLHPEGAIYTCLRHFSLGGGS